MTDAYTVKPESPLHLQNPFSQYVGEATTALQAGEAE